MATHHKQSVAVFHQFVGAGYPLSHGLLPWEVEHCATLCNRAYLAMSCRSHTAEPLYVYLRTM